MMNFRQLHAQSSALLIANVWDATSAASAQELGFEAIASSSSALAGALGYADGEVLPFAELLYIVKRMRAVTTLPLSVDLEGGYARTATGIADNIAALASAGCVGINIEDSVMHNGTRQLLPAETFADLLSNIRTELHARAIDMFINVRCDTFLLGREDALAQTLTRAKLYQAAGADGLFLPCIIDPEQIRAVCAATTLPINVMCMPSLPDFATLSAFGVKRISMGDFVYAEQQRQLKATLKAIQQAMSFAPIFAHEHAHASA